jgi:type IV pilus assembly protein PilM
VALSITWPWRRATTPALVGVDIGLSCLRLVELSRTPNQPIQLERFACEVLPPNSMHDGHLPDRDILIASLRTLWEKSGSKANTMAISLPFTSVLTSTIALPAQLNETQLAFMVEAHATQSLPFPGETVYLDYCPLGPSHHDPNTIDVFMAAARIEQVDERVAIAQSLNIPTSIVDIDTMAARAAMQRIMGPSNNNNALLHIGKLTSHMSVVHGATLVYEREHTFGDQALFDKLTEHTAIPYTQWLTMPLTDTVSEEIQHTIFAPYMALLVHEIEQALQLFFITTHQQITHLYIAGNACLLSRLIPQLQRQLNIAVTIANPFEGMRIPPNLSVPSPEIAAAYVVACGLALRKFDAW